MLHSCRQARGGKTEITGREAGDVQGKQREKDQSRGGREGAERPLYCECTAGFPRAIGHGKHYVKAR